MSLSTDGLAPGSVALDLLLGLSLGGLWGPKRTFPSLLAFGFALLHSSLPAGPFSHPGF